MSKPAAHIEHDQEIMVVSFPFAHSEASTLEAAREWIAEHFLAETATVERLVVDLRGITSLDSASLGPLVQRLRDLQRRKGRMALVGVQAPALREIFSLTRFDQVFRMFPDTTQAKIAIREDPTARFARA